MEAYNRFYKCIHEYERTLLRIAGHDILASREFQRKPMTYMVYAVVFIAITMETYTIIYYGILAKIFCLCTFSLTFQVNKTKLNNSCYNFAKLKWFGTFSGSGEIGQRPSSR